VWSLCYHGLRPSRLYAGITGSFNAHLNNPILLQAFYDNFWGYTMPQYSPICTRLDSQVSPGDYVSVLSVLSNTDIFLHPMVFGQELYYLASMRRDLTWGCARYPFGLFLHQKSRLPAILYGFTRKRIFTTKSWSHILRKIGKKSLNTKLLLNSAASSWSTRFGRCHIVHVTLVVVDLRYLLAITCLHSQP
jgi:hypothetical protein